MPGLKRKDAQASGVADSPVKRRRAEATATKRSDIERKPESKRNSIPGAKLKVPVVKELLDAHDSKDAHAKQRALAKDRKAAKPNADSIQRSKKIWERLRRKSHVPVEERKELVRELFTIITGRVKDFVFKHDSVRVIQCALKYANPEQRKSIAKELQGEYRTLAESRYAKFLVGKILVGDDKDTRDMIISEFCGHVRRLINHPEASWIVDDTYRQVATKRQKEVMLREWYGPEFAIFQNKDGEASPSANLSSILSANPEKKKPIMAYLYGLINQLVQKKLTGFTMLHDAMLQYDLNTGGAETSESLEFLELLKGDDESDLLKNLAFTKSGSRIVCRALARSKAKDRKNILKVYKDNIDMLSYDPNGHLVLLAAYEVVDDTVMTSKLIFPELVAAKLPSVEERQAAVLAHANHKVGRVSLLYPFAMDKVKWLIPAGSDAAAVVEEMRTLRTSTSKKDPEVRKVELVKAISGYDSVLLTTIVNHAAELIQTTFGCQFITEALLGVEGNKVAALQAVAILVQGVPKMEAHLASSVGAMLKTLVVGGHFDPAKKEMVRVEPRLGFADVLYPNIRDHLLDWAVSESSFVIVNMVDDDEEFKERRQVVEVLRRGKARLEEAGNKGNKGAAMLLEKL